MQTRVSNIWSLIILRKSVGLAGEKIYLELQEIKKYL